MAKSKKPTSKENDKAEVHEELKGFDIRIDPFGNLETNKSIDQIKAFLDSKIDDPRLQRNKDEEE